jgi:hypothetical protein
MGIDIETVRNNLNFLREYYGDGKLIEYVHEFGSPTNRGQAVGKVGRLRRRLFSVIDPGFRQALKEVKDGIGYEGDAYTFSDYAKYSSISNIEEDFDRFLRDVEAIVESVESKSKNKH